MERAGDMALWQSVWLALRNKISAKENVNKVHFKGTCK